MTTTTASATTTTFDEQEEEREALLASERRLEWARFCAARSWEKGLPHVGDLDANYRSWHPDERLGGAPSWNEEQAKT